MVKILLTNCHCYYNKDCLYNKGSEAVIISSINIIKKFFNNSEFYTRMYISKEFSEEYKINSYNRNTYSLKFFSIYTTIKTMYLYLLSYIYKNLSRYPNIITTKVKKIIKTKTKLKYYIESDIIVDLSMDLYSDNMGIISIFEHSCDMLIGTNLNKPVVIFAQSIGPFNTIVSRNIAKFTLKKVSLITVREEISKNIIEELGNINIIYVTADPAFLLEKCSTDRINEISKIEKIDFSKRPLIGINIGTATTIKSTTSKSISAISIKKIYLSIQYILPEFLIFSLLKIFDYLGILKKIEDLYLTELKNISEIIDSLIRTTNCHILLIPHNINKEKHRNISLRDDFIFLNNIYKKINNKNRVILLKNNYNAKELKGIIGCCDVFIGGKMHANIAALSQYLPTIAISYSHKFNGIMNMLGQNEFIIEEINNDIISKVQKLLLKKKEIQHQLKFNMKQIEDLALLNGELMKSRINNK